MPATEQHQEKRAAPVDFLKAGPQHLDAALLFRQGARVDAPAQVDQVDMPTARAGEILHGEEGPCPGSDRARPACP